MLSIELVPHQSLSEGLVFRFFAAVANKKFSIAP